MRKCRRRMSGGSFTLIEALAAVALLALALALILPAFNRLSRVLLEDNVNSAVAHVLENELTRLRRSAESMAGRDEEPTHYPEMPQGSATSRVVKELYGENHPNHPENNIYLFKGELRIVAAPGRECSIITYSLKRP